MAKEDAVIGDLVAMERWGGWLLVSTDFGAHVYGLSCLFHPRQYLSIGSVRMKVTWCYLGGIW